jgi:hypothetical protein
LAPPAPVSAVIEDIHTLSLLNEPEGLAVMAALESGPKAIDELHVDLVNVGIAVSRDTLDTFLNRMADSHLLTRLDLDGIPQYRAAGEYNVPVAVLRSNPAYAEQALLRYVDEARRRLLDDIYGQSGLPGPGKVRMSLDMKLLSEEEWLRHSLRGESAGSAADDDGENGGSGTASDAAQDPDGKHLYVEVRMSYRLR